MKEQSDYIYLRIPGDLRREMEILGVTEDELKKQIFLCESGEAGKITGSSGNYGGAFAKGDRWFGIEYTFELDEYLNSDNLFRMISIKEETEKKKEIDDLVAEIKYHNDLYYFQDKNIITDAEYDALLLRLQNLEEAYPLLAREDSPTKQVGDKLKEELGRIAHEVPMLSIQAYFEKKDIDGFVIAMKNTLGEDTTFVVEPKVDGLSVGVRYVDGQYVTGFTRGDGINFGEDVTENMRHIDDMLDALPEKLPYLELRGEVYCTDQSFEAVNSFQAAINAMEFANSRNCASATLRQNNPELLDQRKLSMYLFDIQQAADKQFETDWQQLQYLKELGVSVLPGCVLCSTAEEVWDVVEKLGRRSLQLGFQIDGAVVKVNELDRREKAGATEKVPNWAAAYKYSSDERE